MDIDIRLARDADRVEYQNLDGLATQEVRAEYCPTPEAERSRRALAPQLRRLVAIVNGQVVGTVQYYHRDASLAVLGLGVHPGYRRRGIARALLAHLESVARRGRLRALTLHTILQTHNVPVFQSLGFTAISEEPTTRFEAVGDTNVDKDLIEVFMRKDLFEDAQST